MTAAKVLITEPLSSEALSFLKSDAIQVTQNTALTREELLSVIAEYDVLLVRSQTKVTAEVIKAGKQLKIIGRAGVGVDNIDLEAATRQGIIVMNTPDANTIATAELTFSMILALSRNIYHAVASLKAGRWEREKLTGVELLGKTLGICGLGRIGAEVSRRALSFGMTVIAYDPFVSSEKAAGLDVHLVELDQLLRDSDYITVHLPMTAETRGIINASKFALMKKGVRLVNCARGGLIDEKDLLAAIREKKVAGCALDVFEKEPPTGNPLLELDEVIATPHLGASTREAKSNVATQIAKQVRQALDGGLLENAVNVPRMDTATFAELKPYLDLAEKLGRFHGQTIEGNLEEIRITYAGEINRYQLKPVTLSVLKGFLENTVSDPVNYINAALLARERGIRVTETVSNEPADFANLIRIETITTRTTSSVTGTLFGRRDARIVRINRHHLDAVPDGYLLVCANHDKPGAVAHISAVLAAEGVNIANMTVGRDEAGGKAITVINIDNVLKPETLEALRANPAIMTARLVKL